MVYKFSDKKSRSDAKLVVNLNYLKPTIRITQTNYQILKKETYIHIWGADLANMQ